MENTVESYSETKESGRIALQTPKFFKEWLISKNLLSGSRFQSIGIRKTCDRCPIANFLKGYIGSPIVTSDTIGFITFDSRQILIFLKIEDGTMPLWVSKFIKLLDEKSFTNSITATTAQEILALVETELELIPIK